MVTSRLTRIGIAVGITSGTIALLQAMELRKKYVDRVKLVIPNGPHSGLEKAHHPFQKRNDDNVTKTSLAMVQELLQKTNQTMENIRNSAAAKTNVWFHRQQVPNRKVKLIILGDSLVCGIGCDEGISSSSSSSSGPVLPQIVAKVLSIAMQADVEWSSTGIVGGTVADMRRQLLPAIKRELCDSTMIPIASSSTSSSSHLSTPQSQFPNEEVLIVIICGLNDFKQVNQTSLILHIGKISPCSWTSIIQRRIA